MRADQENDKRNFIYYIGEMEKLTDKVEKILNAARTALPESLGEDVKGNIRAAIKSAVEELDVVTREEFEIQQAVLEKTRKKLEEMEAIVAELEKKKK